MVPVPRYDLSFKGSPSPSAGKWELGRGKVLTVTMLLPQVAQKRGQGGRGDPGHGRQSPASLPGPHPHQTSEGLMSSQLLPSSRPHSHCS